MEKDIQFKRFLEIINPTLTFTIVKCNNCPLNNKCNNEKNADDFEHTCSEALWYYIQTGEYLK